MLENFAVVEAQGEAVIQLHSVTDDLNRGAVSAFAACSDAHQASVVGIA